MAFQWQNFVKNQSLRSRLITWFLLIAIIPIVWTTIISYEMCKKILFDQATRHLGTVIISQEKLLNFYFNEKKSDARAFIKDQSALEAITKLDQILSTYGKDSPEHLEAKQKFDQLLTYRMKALDYQNLFLLTQSGTIVYSTLKAPGIGDNLLTSDKYINFAKIFEKSRSTLNPELFSLALYPDKNAIYTFISVPVLDYQNHLAGCVIVELSNSALYQFLSNLNVPNALANLFIVADIEKSFYTIHLFPASENKEIPNSLINPSSSFGEFILLVLNQEDLVIRQIDFNDQKNLMVGKKFESAMNWAFVTSIDEAKLFNPIKMLKYFFWILVTATAAAVIFSASSIAKKIAAPILLLTKKTQTLADGDLSQRIEVKSNDEVGRLSQSFNEMAAQLEQMVNHLDFLVAKRTKEYEIQNVKLEKTIKELRQTRDRLVTQEKLASLGALTAGIAHEIKNPLNFINNFSDLSIQIEKDLEIQFQQIKDSFSEENLKTLLESLQTLKVNLQKIYEHGQRADSIVFNMLQHSRGMPGEKSKTDINKMLRDYIDLSYHGMRARDPNFNVKIETQLDPKLQEIEVVPQEISRVFLNLLNNAFYSVNQKKLISSSESNYDPTVKISSDHNHTKVIIKIWDNGTGIAPEIFPKLFTPFFTTKPTGEGTGLGLSLSYNIVVQGHGGTLSANSKEGEFAEFIITLPCNE